MQRASRLALLLVLLLAAVSARAQESIAFDQLTPAEQRVLMPFAEQWPNLPAQTQQNLRLGAQRWNALTPQEKRGAAQRFGQWQQLPDAEKRRVRERYRAFRQMPPTQQQRLRDTFQRFQRLPPDQRAQMRRRFEGMAPRERRAFLEGMRSEQQLGARERMLQAIPPEQRAATEEMMARFTPPERQRLIAHMRQLAPAERDALRVQLAYPPGETVPVSYSGGLFNTGAVLLAPLRSHLATRCPGFELRAPLLSPSIGAALYAARDCGRPFTSDEVDRLRDTGEAATDQAGA